jgi:ribosomal 50S subunit-recycling heat shock protein
MPPNLLAHYLYLGETTVVRQAIETARTSVSSGGHSSSYWCQQRHHISSGGAGRGLDQWLWFARFVKTRSLAARLCTAEAVTVNGATIRKANHTIRIGDTVIVPQGVFRRTVRVLALGLRRGPAAEARLLYEEIAALHRSELAPAWEPLLVDADEAQNKDL